MMLVNILQSILNNPTSQIKYLTKIYKPNEKVLCQGKPHPNLYLILKGKLRVTVSNVTTDQDKTNVRPGIVELGPEEVFGEFGLFEDSPASADIIAIVESELIEVDIISLRRFLEANPKEGYKVLSCLFKVLVARLRRADQTIIQLYSWGIKAHQIDKLLE